MNFARQKVVSCLEPSPAKKCKSNSASIRFDTTMNSQEEPPAKKPKPNAPDNEHQPNAIIPYATDRKNESERTETTTTHWNAEQAAKIAEWEAEKDQQLAEQAEKLAERAAKFAEQIAKQKAEWEAEMDQQLAEKDQQLAERAKLLYENSLASMFYDEDSPSRNIEPSELIGTDTSHSYPKLREASAHTKVFKVHYMKQVLSNELKEFDFKFYEVQSVYKVGYERRTLESASDFRYCLNAIVHDAAEICNDIPQPKVLLEVRCASSWFTNVMDHVEVCDRETRTPILAVKPNSFSNEEQQDEEDKEEALGKNLERVLPNPFSDEERQDEEDNEVQVDEDEEQQDVEDKEEQDDEDNEEQDDENEEEQDDEDEEEQSDEDEEDKEEAPENGLDQLLAMKLTGHSIPFVAITNLTCTQITWLDTKVHRDIVDDHNQKGFDLKRLVEIIQPTTGSERQKKEQHDVDTNDWEVNTTDGTICRSEVFSRDKIIDVFVNVIFCALHHYDRARNVVELELEKMVQIDGTIGLTKEGHVRGKVQSVYKGPLTRTMRRESSSDTLYLVNFIRSGGTSKVYRAISESGHDCVIKMFVHCRGTSIMSEKQFQRASKKLADEEFANYEAIYGTDTLMNYMWRETLNNVHCIIMPLFRPIQMEERNSKAVQDAITLRLQQFCKAGKVFEPDDQSWRHIGYFHDALYLFDLGYLVKLEEPVATYISDHWQCLANE